MKNWEGNQTSRKHFNSDPKEIKTFILEDWGQFLLWKKWIYEKNNQSKTWIFFEFWEQEKSWIQGKLNSRIWTSAFYLENSSFSDVNLTHSYRSKDWWIWKFCFKDSIFHFIQRKKKSYDLELIQNFEENIISFRIMI